MSLSVCAAKGPCNITGVRWPPHVVSLSAGDGGAAGPGAQGPLASVCECDGRSRGRATGVCRGLVVVVVVVLFWCCGVVVWCVWVYQRWWVGSGGWGPVSTVPRRALSAEKQAPIYAILAPATGTRGTLSLSVSACRAPRCDAIKTNGRNQFTGSAGSSWLFSRVVRGCWELRVVVGTSVHSCRGEMADANEDAVITGLLAASDKQPRRSRNSEAMGRRGSPCPSIHQATRIGCNNNPPALPCPALR